MFDSLDTLSALIETYPTRAVAMDDRLAEVYRYLLANRARDLVPWVDELALVEEYAFLLRIRFGDALT